MSEEDDDQPSLFWEDRADQLVVTNDPDDLVLKKHRAIIHRTHGRTITEERLFSGFLIAAKVAVKTGQDPKDGFVTNEKFLRTFSGIKSKNLTHIYSVIDTLQEKAWKFDYFDEDEKLKEKRVFATISEARYMINGDIHFFLPPTLQEVLKNPDFYAAIDSRITNLLQCVYAAALYEISQAYMGRSMVFENLKKFREYMGVREKEYPRFTDLRRHVIDKGCDEVNLKTDVNVEWEPLKEGKAVTGIKFFFSQKSVPLEIPADTEQLELVASMSINFPQGLRGERWVVDLLTKQIKAKGVEWTQSNVDAFLERLNSKIGAPVRSPGAVFRTAFKEDHGKSIRDAKKVRELLKEMDGQPTAETPLKERERLAREKNDAEKAEFVAEVQKYQDHFNQMPAAVKATIRAEIEKLMKTAPGSLAYAGPENLKIHKYLTEEMQLVL